MTPTTEQFREAIAQSGMIPPDDVIADGKLRRFSPSGRRGDDAAWYVLHGDGIPAGAFGDWRSGVESSWRADMGRPLTVIEEAAHRERIAQQRTQREAEEARRRVEARTKASAIWKAAKPVAAIHPYLVRKGIQPHDAREYQGALVVPMRAAGELHSLQFIADDGAKRFLAGGRVAGCYCAIGKPGDALVICEGFATGASIREATGLAVAVAFNAGNLGAVALSLRERFPDLRLIVAADDDAATPGNPGLSKATEAARAVGGLLAVPGFGEDRPAGASDFNDLAKSRGVEAVRACMAVAARVEAPQATPAGASLPTPSAHPDRAPGALVDGVEIVCASSIKPEPVDWLWAGFLAAGKLHVLAGAPGTGKTTLALALAATITSAGRWPDGTTSQRGSVLVWSGEDDPADTLVPRLIASGADLARVHFIGRVSAPDGVRSFDPSADFPALEVEAARIPSLRLVIVDPIVNAVAGDSHKSTEVRRGLQPLVDFAARAGCAVLGISHFSKGTAGRDVVERVTGSLAFGALARVVLATAKPADDQADDGRLMVRAKSNIGPDGGGFRYELRTVSLTGPYSGIEASRAEWGQPVEGGAREILATVEQVTDPEERSDLEDAKAFLADLLADGPIPARRGRSECEGAGHSWATVRRAMKGLGVVSEKEAMAGPWRWRLPPKVLNSRGNEHLRRCSENPEDAHLKAVSTFGGNEHLRGREAPEADGGSELL
jgi:putative DNA primase/helicase